MSQTENKENVHCDDKEMESKKKKLYPCPEEEVRSPNLSKKRKTSATKSPHFEEKENISVNKNATEKEEGEVATEETKSVLKSNTKSASKARARVRSKSRSNVKCGRSKSKSKSKSRSNPREVEEEEITTSAYSLRPRKPIDYTKEDPVDIQCGETGNEDEKSDVSFRIDQVNETEEKVASPEKKTEPLNTGMILSQSPLEEGEVAIKEVPVTEDVSSPVEEAKDSDVSSDEEEKIDSPALKEQLRDELKELQG